MIDELKAQATQTYVVVHKAGRYALHEAYVHGQDTWLISLEPVYPMGIPLEDLRANTFSYQVAVRGPAWEYTDLVPGFDEASFEVEGTKYLVPVDLAESAVGSRISWSARTGRWSYSSWTAGH
jgi:hypothetical protein